MHRRVVRRVQIVVELVANDDVVSSISKIVHVVRDVGTGAENEVGLDVAQGLVHFRGEVGHPRRRTCRRTRHR